MKTLQNPAECALRLMCAATCGFALAACATPSEPTVKTVEVRVPVVQPCRAETPTLPAFPDTNATLLSAPDVFEQMRLLLAGREMRIADDAGVRAALAVCTAP